MNMDILRLPEALTIRDRQFAINADWRFCVNIMRMFERQDLTDNEKILCMVDILYKEEIPDELTVDAAEQAIWFLNMGENMSGNGGQGGCGRLFSWEQDLRFIISAVEHATHKQIRSMEFYHWWEFMSGFYEIGECVFSTLVHQRKQKKTGKQSKADKEWWAENKDIAELKIEYTDEEKEALERFNALLRGGEERG